MTQHKREWIVATSHATYNLKTASDTKALNKVLGDRHHPAWFETIKAVVENAYGPPPADAE